MFKIKSWGIGVVWVRIVIGSRFEVEKINEYIICLEGNQISWYMSFIIKWYNSSVYFILSIYLSKGASISVVIKPSRNSCWIWSRLKAEINSLMWVEKIWVLLKLLISYLVLYYLL